MFAPKEKKSGARKCHTSPATELTQQGPKLLLGFARVSGSTSIWYGQGLSLEATGEAGSPLTPPALEAWGFFVLFEPHHISAPSKQG